MRPRRTKHTQSNSNDDSLMLNQVTKILDRATLTRQMGKQFEGERDLYDVFGFHRELSYQDYYKKYDRQDIAGRIVDFKPNETWRKPPKIVEDIKGEREGDEQTEFEQQWQKIAEDRDIKLWNKINRADRIAGIGEYGVILLGIDDGQELENPVNVDNASELMYLSPYSQGSVRIEEWETDPMEPRFGMPTKYSIKLRADLAEMTDAEVNEVDVHHSRIIHIPSDDLDENEVYGRPRLKRVFNLLDSLQKVAGATPENFFQNAKKELKAQVQDDYSLSPDDKEELEQQFQAFIHNFTSMIRTEGVDVEQFQKNVADPSNPFDVIVSLISAATSIPKRILLGSERGELASSQDERAWLSVIEERQNNFATQEVLAPLIDKLQEFGILPKANYEIKWPDLFQKDEMEETEVMQAKIEAANELVVGAANMFVDIDAVLEELGLPVEQTDIDEEEIDEEDEEVQEQFEQMKAGD